MTKTGRLLYILSLVRTHKSLNAGKLAELCGVTERTIYRDIATLSEASIPIYYDRGYRLSAETFLPPLNLSIEEYLVLKTALTASPLAEDNPNRRTVHQLLQKLNAVVNGNISFRLRGNELFNYLNPKSTDRFGPESGRIFELLEKAIVANQRVLLKYVNLSGRRSERLVDPYFIIYRRHGFYLVGRCHLRGELRTFRIARIRALRITDQIFKREAGINARTYFGDSWEIFTGTPQAVKIEFSGTAAQVMRGSRHHPSEKIRRQKNGKLLYTARISNLDELARWLAGFGGEARVIGPPELRAKICRLCQSLVQRYRRNPR